MGHRSSFWIKLSFGIGHPPAIHQLQCICVGEGSRVPNLQTEFNYLDSFKVMAFLVISLSPWSPWSPHCPHHPHVIPVIPVIPMSSPHCLCHPHIIPIAPRRSPCGLHGSGLHGLHLCCSHCPRGPHVIPVVPTSFLSSPHHPHIIPTLSRRSPYHPQSPKDTHSTHHPPPCRGGGTKSVKMQ